MTKNQIFALLGSTSLAAAAVAAPLTAQSTGPSTQFGEWLLRAHNAERVRVGAVPLQ